MAAMQNNNDIFTLGINAMNIWVTECNGKRYIHFRQLSADKKKNYIFMKVDDAESMLRALGVTGDEGDGFIDVIVCHQGAFLVELVECEDGNYRLQMWSSKDKAAVRYVSICDMDEFQMALEEVLRQDTIVLLAKCLPVLKRAYSKNKNKVNIFIPLGDSAHSKLMRRLLFVDEDKYQKDLEQTPKENEPSSSQAMTEPTGPDEN